jgi:UDP-N-acetylglucosamine 2-epimerase (non-hydrolysing)
MTRYTIDLIAGARPNFMKIAPLYHSLMRTEWANPRIVHTDQHWDENLSKLIFRDLGLPTPHFSLGAGGGTQGEVTAKVLVGYEKICLESPPDLTVVVGDVNSTMAAAIAATKLHIPIAHLEAGLRSNDRRMPEEVNRLVTDQLADLLWIPSLDGRDHLLREGIPSERIEFVGNIMIDSFEMLRDRIEANDTRTSLRLSHGGYALVTLHRPSNVDDPARLIEIVSMLERTAESIPCVYPVHPRTRGRLDQIGVWARLQLNPRIVLVDPLPYIAFMNLLVGSRLALTDSGGLQEETTYLGIPCLTLRENTERPITVNEGTNQLVALDTVDEFLREVLEGKAKVGRIPTLWDGRTSERVADSAHRFVRSRR